MKYNNKYDDSFDRCETCKYWYAYYFDEWDSDAGCDLEKDTQVKNCEYYKPKEE